MNYVAGFMFNEDKDKVLLIEKQKPDWQKGKLNGIGGKIEKDELPYDAMVREFKEEVGIECNDWESFCLLIGDDWVVYFYKAIGPIHTAKQIEIEKPVVVNVNELPDNIITNLSWLIPMAKMKVNAKVEYRDIQR